MPLYTQSFKIKLEELKTKLEDLLQKNYQAKESSDYSVTMLKTLCNVINNILENNDPEFLIDNKDAIKKDFDFIDNQQGTFIPAIFNQQSLELAIALRNFLKIIDINQDFAIDSWGVKLRTVLFAANQTPEQWLQKYIKNLEINIRVYEELKCSSEVKAQTTNISQAFYDEFVLLKQKIQQANKSKNLDAVYADIKQAYEGLANKYIEQAKSLPYMRLTVSDAWLNASEPYLIFISEGARFAMPARVELMKMCFLDLEEQLNNLLPQDKQLSTVYDYLNQLVQAVAIQQAPQAFKVFLEQLDAQIKTYQTGKHLSWWQSVDKDKKQLLVNASLELHKLKAEDIFTVNEACGICFQKNAEHYALVKEKNTSTGMCGEILSDAVFGLLEMLFAKEEKSDAGIQSALVEYKKAQEARFSAIISTPTM